MLNPTAVTIIWRVCLQYVLILQFFKFKNNCAPSKDEVNKLLIIWLQPEHIFKVVELHEIIYFDVKTYVCDK